VSGGVVPRIRNLGIKGGEWSASRLGRFSRGDRASGTHWTGWVGPTAGLDTISVNV